MLKFIFQKELDEMKINLDKTLKEKDLISK